MEHPSSKAEPMVIGESFAARRIGMITEPMVTAVLVWLTIGMLTKKPTITVPGTSSDRTAVRGRTSKCTRC